MAYTTEELEAIVDSYLLTKVEVPRFDSQTRNTLAVRDAVYDLLTAALFLKPDALFYVVWLAKNRATGSLDAELALIDAIIDAASKLDDRAVYKVEAVTDLTRAEAALLELNGVMNSSTGLKNAAVPAVQKFRSSIEAFARTELQKNVVDGGDVVETPDELRALIYTKWQDARALRVTNRAEVTAVTNALASFEGVRLQTRILARIVSKMRTRLAEIKTVMQGDSAIEQSREAFLELLAQRTLLTKAASFKTPQRIVFSGRLTLLDSPGTPPTISGAAFSAPFMHRADAGFSVQTEDVVECEVTFGRDTRAALRSIPLLSFPLALATLLPPATISLIRDSAMAPASFTFGADPVSGLALAAAIQAGLSLAADEVVWDALNSELVIYGGDGLESYAELVVTTAAEANFVAAAYPGVPLAAEATPSDVAFVAETLALAASGAAARAAVFDAGAGPLGRFQGISSGSSVYSSGAMGFADLVSTTQWENADVDLVALGVRPGDVLLVGLTTLVITSVAATSFTTESTVLAPGTYGFNTGADLRGIPVGAAVRISAERPDGGDYRVVAPLPGDLGNQLRLDRALNSVDVGFEVSDHRVGFRGRTTAVSSTLEILDATTPPPTPGLAAMGHVGSGPVHAEVTRASSGTDLLLAGVRVGDKVTLDPAGVREVAAIGPYYLDMIPGVLAPLTQAATVERPAHIAFDAMVAALAAAGTEADPAALDLVVARLIRGARYTPQAAAVLNAHRAYLAALRAALAAFQVAKEKSIDFVARTMEEQGMDRALDLFLGLNFTTLFGLEPDAVSYSTNFVRRAAETTRAVAPASKGARGQNGVQDATNLVTKARGYDPWAGS